MIAKISNNLRIDQVNKAAKATNFIIRESEITEEIFIAGLFACFAERKFSLRIWALAIASIFRIELSKQALGNRLTEKSSAFFCPY